MHDNFKEFLGKDGRIYVNDLFQICTVDPRVNPLAESPFPNIFAYGDVCQTSLNEPKGALSIAYLREQITSNVIL